MDRISDLIGPVIEAANSHFRVHDGDFVDSDGLIVCGRCHERRQMFLPPFEGEADQKIVVPCGCRCDKEEWEREKQERKAREDAEVIARLKEQSMMSPRFASATFTAFSITKLNEKVYKKCLWYAEHINEMIDENQGLLFYGPPGTGKTFSAACIANYVLNRRITVFMTSFVKLLSAFGPNGDKDNIIGRMNRAKLLILDDFGSERGSEYSLEQVYNILDSRYRVQLPVIITTNIPIEAMTSDTDMTHARIYDRVFEMCDPVEFSGMSWRKREAVRRRKTLEARMKEEE